MENIDLNIHNYELNDLLNLFHLPFRFEESHLKEAKKIVLKTHPDKSGLEKEYFLFFSQAYKYLLKIYRLRQCSSTTLIDYDKDDLWKKEHNVLIDGKISSMNKKEYHTWFNDTFEKMKMKDEVEETGYGEWLKSDDDLVTDTVSTSDEMNKYMRNKKQELRALVVHRDFQNFNSSNSGEFDLVRETPENYSSCMFNKLQFEDLRKAHAESVIPVTDEDFHNKKKYASVDELLQSRTRDNIKNREKGGKSDEDKIQILNTTSDDINIHRAYKLLSQDERIRSNYYKFWSDLKQLEN
jgi:hypothetical protein